jgi:class 3 adenylate cyclase/tetratricopeptide (TPR) repeat protein
MFCDLVGFTELTERLDPEDLTSVVKAYQSAVVTAVERYDGFVARYFGDGVMAYFGYPNAHEDDPERAVRAALDILTDLARIRSEHTDALRARIGIATGRVVVGDVIGRGASEEASVLGITPNLAARLQGLAEPQQVLVAARTWKLVSHAFDGIDLGKHAVKGIRDPVGVWRVSGVLASRFADGGEHGVVVGRVEESAAIHSRWDRAQTGEGQVVVVTAEPGVGKSTLIRSFRAASEPGLEILLSGSPFHRHSAFHTVSEMVARRLGDTVPELVAGIRGAGLDDTTVAPLLAAMLGLPPDPAWPPLEAGSQTVKEQQMEAVTQLLHAWSGDLSLLLILEDIHWVDASTLTLVERLIHEGRTRKQLVLATTRPEASFAPDGSEALQLSLDRLSKAETADLVRSVAGDRALSPSTIDDIVQRTDGVPLYAEELTRSLIEGEGAHQAIPDTLQDSLMARLDRLPSSKDIAQFAATVGRTFSLDLLAVASQQPIEVLRVALTELVASGLVYDTGGSDFIFKHALVRDAAYTSLLKATRRGAHGRLAAHLDEPDQVAQHHAAAGQFTLAVAAYRQASDLAIASWAYVESNAHLQAALDNLGCAPTTDGTDELRQELLVAQGEGLRVIGAHEEAAAVLDQAIALGRLDDGRRLSQAHYLLGGVLFSMGQIDRCVEAHQAAQRYASEAGSTQHEVQALSGMGDALYAAGHMRGYFEALDRCVQLADNEPELEAVAIANLGPRGYALTYLCEFERGVTDGNEGARRAAENGLLRVDMIARITALVFSNLALGRYGEVERHIEVGQDLARRLGSQQWGAGGQMMRAMARDFAGEADAADLARAAVDAVREHAAFFYGCWSHGVLARATTDADERAQATAEGERLLVSSPISHNHLWFPRLAMEASVNAGDWDTAERMIGLLEDYTAEQRLPWSDLVIQAGRLRVAAGRGRPDLEGISALRAELEAVRWTSLERFLDGAASGR